MNEHPTMKRPTCPHGSNANTAAGQLSIARGPQQVPSAMKIVKRRAVPGAQVSLVLLDWGVRESFHLLHYLRRQSIPRDVMETILVEYTSTQSAKAQPFLEQVDAYILMGVDREEELAKHAMYNVGLLASQGRIVVFCDSDAMVKPGFIETIIGAFPDGSAGEAGRVFHIDQFRNNDRRFYPFCYPEFEQIEGPGCINFKDDKTTGLADSTDTLHSRNYGACMCALRDDLIAIGGADEHASYLGHICGPYDMTFRLVNAGRVEIWSQTEFMYHTWHPGEGGTLDHYIGPNKGYVASTTIEALLSGRVAPLVENPEICRLREGERLTPLTDEELATALGRMSAPAALHDRQTLPVLRRHLEQWPLLREYATALPPHRAPAAGRVYDGTYRAWRIYREFDRFTAESLVPFRTPGIDAVEAACRDELLQRLRRIDERVASPAFVRAYHVGVALAVMARLPAISRALASRGLETLRAQVAAIRGRRTKVPFPAPVGGISSIVPLGPDTLPPGPRQRRPRSRRKWLVLRTVYFAALAAVLVVRAPALLAESARRGARKLRLRTRTAEIRARRWLRQHEGNADLAWVLHAIDQPRGPSPTCVITTGPVERRALAYLAGTRRLPPFQIASPRNLDEMRSILRILDAREGGSTIIARSTVALRYWSEFAPRKNNVLVW